MSEAEPSYERRTVDEWVRRANEGHVAITDFQRSFVWDGGRVAGYIEAIFKGEAGWPLSDTREI